MLKAGDKIIMTKEDYTLSNAGGKEFQYPVGSVWELAEEASPTGIIYKIKDARCDYGEGLIYGDRCKPYDELETLYDGNTVEFELVDELKDDEIPFNVGDKVTATVTTGDIKKDTPYTVESILFDDKGVYQGVKLAETKTLLHRTLVDLYKSKYPVTKGDLVKSLVNWANLKKGYIYQVDRIETSNSDVMGVWVYADNEDLDKENTHYLTRKEFIKWSDDSVGTVSFNGTTKDVINKMKEYIEHHDF